MKFSPTNFIKYWFHKAGSAYVNVVCRREFDSQIFHGINERPVEYRFVFEQVTRYCPSNVLDVGTGKSALPQLVRNCGPLVTAIDNVDDYWTKGMSNRHYNVIQDNILATMLPHAAFDMVTCVSVLEHIPDHNRAIRSMVDLLQPGGNLVLTFPFNERSYVENVYALPGSIGAGVYSFTTQVFSREEVVRWCQENRLTLIRQEWWRFYDGEFWTQGRPVCPPEHTGPDLPHHIACIVLQKGHSK